MNDRIVVLNRDDPLAFVGDACAAFAESANRIRVGRAVERDLTAAYAEMVVAYSGLLRDRLGEPRTAIVDHLIMRLRQAQAGEIAVPVLDIVDRLHGELTAELSAV